MRVWTKPVFDVEVFELSQTIATGCGTIPAAGELITQSCCKPGTTEYFNPGSKHPYIEKYLEDTNNDGKISQSEFQAALDACAAAFAEIGEGHTIVHSVGVKYKGGPIPSDLFSS